MNRTEADDNPRSQVGQQDNLQVISDMETQGLEERSSAEQFSDLISSVASTPTFAVAHLAFFGAWVTTQSGLIPVLPEFDPYPFTFLTFLVSLEAIFLSIFVLISQGRMTRHTERRSHLNLQVDLLAEQESTNALKLLRTIAEHLEVPDVPTEEELEAPTSVRKLIDDVEKVSG